MCPKDPGLNLQSYCVDGMFRPSILLQGGHLALFAKSGTTGHHDLKFEKAQISLVSGIMQVNQKSAQEKTGRQALLHCIPADYMIVMLNLRAICSG